MSTSGGDPITEGYQLNLSGSGNVQIVIAGGKTRVAGAHQTLENGENQSPLVVSESQKTVLTISGAQTDGFALNDVIYDGGTANIARVTDVSNTQVKVRGEVVWL